MENGELTPMGISGKYLKVKPDTCDVPHGTSVGTSVGTSASQSQWRTGMPIGKYTVVYDLGGNARKLCKIWFGPDEKRQKGQGYTFHEIKKRTWKENDK